MSNDTQRKRKPRKPLAKKVGRGRPPTGRTRRHISVTLDKDLHTEAKRFAFSAGVSLSALINTCLKAEMEAAK